MSKLKAKMLEPTQDYKTGDLIIPFRIDKETVQTARQTVDKFLPVDKDLSLEIKRWRNPRTIGANAYCWKLCTEIAKTDEAGLLTKEEVYRRNVLEVGVYEPLPIKEIALQSFIERWQYKGVGWLVEVVDDSKLEGYKLVHAYYGSSTYNTKEMWRLLKSIEQDARSVGVEVLTEQERTLMMQEYENA